MKLHGWKLAIATAVGALLVCFSAAPNHARDPNKPAPNLVLDANRFDFGAVDEGARVKHVFKITNGGAALLKIFSAYASCGCTLASLEKKELQPGETTDLTVTVDTAMKQNKITKIVSVCSNDPVHPVSPIELAMDVKDPHKGMSADAGAKIFTDQHCATCHVQRGVGLHGRELYNADCAMCHGPKAEGAVGPPLFGVYSNPEFKTRITEILSFGSKTHRSMPGFLNTAGGPLSQDQVDSIITYLTKLSKARGIK